MTKNLIGIVNELHDSDSLVQKRELSQLAGELLKVNKTSASSFLVPLIEKLSFYSGLDNFENIMNSEFYELKIVPYIDDDENYKISIRMSFLQDFENFSENLDELVILMIAESLSERNLDILVNDICVNLIQYRNGVIL